MSKIASSIFIVGGEKIVMMILQFLGNIILARILSPDDYGTISMVAVFIALSTIFVDSGLGGSLVYYKDTNKKDYNTVFWFNLIVSVLIYFILFVSSDFVGAFYNNNQISNIVKVLGLVIVFNSFSVVQYSILYKELKFKAIAITSIISYCICFLVSLTLAINGFGVWALVAQQVFHSIINTIILVFYTKFIPGFNISFILLKKHWTFGKGCLGSSIVKTIYENIYLQITGKYCSIFNAGLFNQANKMKNIPVDLFCQTFEKALFPLLAKCDKKEFNSKLKKISSFFSFFVIPIFISISISSEVIVNILLGEKWLSSSWILSLLSIGGIFMVFEAVNRSALKACGKTQVLFKIELLKRSISVLIIFLSLFYFDLEGIVFAFIFNSIMGWIFNCFFINKFSDYTLFNQIKDLMYYFIPSIIILLIIYTVKDEFSLDLIDICLINCIYLISYFGFYYLIKNEVMKIILGLIKTNLTSSKNITNEK